MENASITLTATDAVQCWWDEATAKLRWNNGVLEQMHLRHGLNAYGQEIKRDEEWKRIPSV